MKLLWLIPLLPAAGAALNGLFGIRWFSRTLAGTVACAVMAGALGLSLWALADLLALPAGERIHEAVLGQWIPPVPLATAHGIGTFVVPWSLRLDPLAALMLLIVTGVGFLIHVYATAHMKDEPRGGYARFFCYLNLFCFFMLLLVLAGNFLVMFVGWEGVGLCSYLLIGFWYENTRAVDAGKKAFITNRIGDWGFILGVLLVFFTFGTLDFREVASAAAAMPRETSAFGPLSLICLLLFVGATGKSAQIPLFVWLPDAMEGPITVSALLHAATMVTAGVYMAARNAVLFEQAPLVMQIVAIVGALTAVMAATVALVQNDIKRVLAYSTVSQLGYMFLAAGVGAFAAAIFHLVTHAFFKALLFLGSGSVIQAVGGEQDMQRMGGLKKYMPVTFVTMMFGTAAIAGIPPMSGFFSKDTILSRAFAENRMLWFIALATTLLTAFYMFRLMALTFYGSYRGPAWASAPSPAAPDAPDAPDSPGVWRGPHEPPGAMTTVLMALAVGAIVAGFIGIPQALGGTNAIDRFLEPSFAAPEVTLRPDAGAAVQLSRGVEIGLMFLSVLVAAAGLLAARHFYIARPEADSRLAAKWPRLHALLLHEYYLDEFYRSTAVRGALASARWLWTFDLRVVDGVVNGSGSLTQIVSWCSHMFDKHVVDGLVNAVGWSANRGSLLARRAQTGLVQNYALLMVAGVVVFLTVYLLAR